MICDDVSLRTIPDDPDAAFLVCKCVRAALLGGLYGAMFTTVIVGL